MTLAAGTRLGPYEIASPLGAGGMGEVYKARDSRLGREVAIKVLSSAIAGSAEHLRRFEQEARSASALSDPHIVTVFDVGEQDGIHYFASELVEGGDLRSRLSADGLPIKKVIELAEQIASGLASAHEKGITHRDLKPENILLTKSGAAKIADFGLAKLAETPDAELSQMPTADRVETTAGVVMGTVSYMSPEQAAGRTVDYRSDQFSFGLILYEMLTGKLAFRRETKGETLAAILRDEPTPITDSNPAVPAPLLWVVERCLSKDREERYSSTRDLARDLSGLRQHLSDSSSSALRPSAPARAKGLAVRVLLASALVLAIAAVAILATRSGGRTWPSFQRLTSRRGTVSTARFAADGRTVVYSAQWEGKPPEVFSVASAGSESRALGLGEAMLVSVSSADELALKLHPRLWTGQLHGTLARVPLSGGSPRELLENALIADWMPDGSALATVHLESGLKFVIEFPQGKPLFEEHASVRFFRISPDGNRIAVAEGQIPWWKPSLALLDRSGAKRTLTDDDATGVAWGREGKEIWLTSDEAGGATNLWAISPSGRRRLVYRAPGAMALQDISRNGDLLVSILRRQSSVMYRAPGASRESDLAWHDGSQAVDISSDGGTLLLSEGKPGAGPGDVFYLRKTDGSPAIRLGEGVASDFSSDGKRILAQALGSKRTFLLVPTGAGETKRIPSPVDISQGWLFPDGRRILISGILPNGQVRVSSIDLDGKGEQPIAPVGFDAYVGELPMSPDGKLVALNSSNMTNTTTQIFSTDGGPPRPVPGFENDDVIIRWAEDGRSLFVFKRNEVPVRVFRLDVLTGKRTPWLELMPADPAGVTRIPEIVLSADGHSYAYNFTRELSDLYLIQGLK